MSDSFTYEQPKKIYNIGILEIRRHIPILYTFLRIFKMKNTKITIFTTKDLFQRLNAYVQDFETCEIVLKSDSESIKSFLKRVEEICNQKFDLLFINTIHETVLDLICYLGFNPMVKKILLVHHVNAWLNPTPIWNVLHPIRMLDTNAASILIKYFILPKFDAINVIYRPLKNYILNNKLYDKEIFTLPTSIYEEKVVKSAQKNEKVKITIPGLIQEHRKNYNPVLNAFNKLAVPYKNSFSLSIPGFPIGRFGKRIYKHFDMLKKAGCDVMIFDQFVADEIFDEILTQCDIILAPIKIQSKSDGEIKEIYGKTVGSGIIFNAIKYAKPLLIPQEFTLLPELKSSAITYANAHELVAILEELFTNPEKLNTMKNEALMNAKKFSLSIFQNYFKETLIPWISS